MDLTKKHDQKDGDVTKKNWDKLNTRSWFNHKKMDL